MRLPGRAKVIVALSVMAVCLSPTAVSAAFWIVLDRTTGSSGTVVHGTTLGSGSVTLATSQALPLFLVGQALASEIESPTDKRLTPLGELVVDANGDGTTTFTIPEIAPGRYVVLVHCEPCAPASTRATMLLGADLRVTVVPPATDTVVASTFAVWPLFALGFAVATLVAWRRVPKRPV